MSADNYLAIRYDSSSTTKPWVVYEGNASTGDESRLSGHPNRGRAFDRAQEILEEEDIEYGIAHIDKKPEESK